MAVKIDNIHVHGSPAAVQLVSKQPDLTRCRLYGEGTHTAIKEAHAVFFIQFHDKYGNSTLVTPEFQRELDVQMRLVERDGRDQHCHPFDGEWVQEGFEPGYLQYRVRFIPQVNPGSFGMHVWWKCQEPGGRQDQHEFPGSPFTITVHASSSDQVSLPTVLL